MIHAYLLPVIIYSGVCAAVALGRRLTHRYSCNERSSDSASPGSDDAYPSCAVLGMALSLGVAASLILLLLLLHPYATLHDAAWNDRFALGLASVLPAGLVFVITDASQSIIPRVLTTASLINVATFQIIFQHTEFDIRVLIMFSIFTSLLIVLYTFRNATPTTRNANWHRMAAVIAYLLMIILTDTTPWLLGVLILMPAVILWITHIRGQQTGGGDTDMILLCGAVLGTGIVSPLESNYVALSYLGYRYQLIWLIALSVLSILQVVAFQLISLIQQRSWRYTKDVFNRTIKLAPTAFTGVLLVGGLRAFEIVAL